MLRVCTYCRFKSLSSSNLLPGSWPWFQNHGLSVRLLVFLVIWKTSPYMLVHIMFVFLISWLFSEKFSWTFSLYQAVQRLLIKIVRCRLPEFFKGENPNEDGKKVQNEETIKIQGCNHHLRNRLFRIISLFFSFAVI